jgi:cytoskeleton protein RodZ
MAELGSRLRQARQAKGVTLRDIAAATKISIVTLEALERSDYSRLPGGIFSRAFVRAYALEVGIDPEPAVNEFLAEFARYERDAAQNAKRPEITADDREFLDRQKKALRTLRLAIFGVTLAAVAALAYVLYVWWPAAGVTAPASPPRTSAAPVSAGSRPL